MELPIHMKTDIALQIAKAADQVLNVLIILVLAYFGIKVLGFGIREFKDWWQQREKSNN